MPVPPVAINSLKTALLKTLRESRQLETLFITAATDEQSGESAELTDEQRKKNADRALTILSRYWNAVRVAFPDAWQDRNQFVLMQSIGLTAFSRLGAVVIDDLIQKKTVEESHFEMVIKHVATKVNLEKSQWEGFAGEAGAKVVFGKLRDSLYEDFDKTILISQIDEQISSLLDES